jgi:hypothetical protein
MGEDLLCAVMASATSLDACLASKIRLTASFIPGPKFREPPAPAAEAEARAARAWSTYLWKTVHVLGTV